MQHDWNVAKRQRTCASIGQASSRHDFNGLAITKYYTTNARAACLDYPDKKYGGAAMLGILARGTCVLFLTAMIVACLVFSLGRTSGRAAANQGIWYIHS
jgi:hypothetical protein